MKRAEYVYLKIADFYIRLVFLPTTEWVFLKEEIEKSIKKVYGGFIVKKPKKIDFTISFEEVKRVTLKAPKHENNVYIMFYRFIAKNKIRTMYQIGTFQLQLIILTAVRRLLAYNSAFLLHSSSVLINNRAMLFLGLPGAGKSTTMKLLSSVFKPLADDSSIIRKQNDVWYYYQTPISEKESWVKKSYKGYPVGSLFFVRKSKEFRIEKITDMAYVIRRLMLQYWPEEDYVREQTRAIMDFMSSCGNFYTLYCVKDEKKLVKLMQRFTDENP